MLDKERVLAARARISAADISDDTIQTVVEAYEECRGYSNGSIELDRANAAFDIITSQPRFDWFLEGVKRGNANNALSFFASMRLLGFDVMRKSIAADVYIYQEFSFTRAAGIDAPMLQAIGWVEQAKEVVEYAWTDYLEENRSILNVVFGEPAKEAWSSPHSNPYLVNKPAWFTTMTTVDEGLWRKHGYDPDMDSLGAYWMLAQVWDNPDPAKVRNALLATREHNIGTTFIKDEPEGNRVYIVDEFLLLYDYDIRSVNMRRKLMGLPVVEVEDYIYDMDLPLEVLPFAKDDVFYPAYVKMCEELGVAPYAPDNSIDVRVDPQTLQVTQV